MVMVKPGMPYLGIVRQVKEAHGGYLRLSGEREYAMLKAAFRTAGWTAHLRADSARVQARRCGRHSHLLALDAAAWLHLP